MVANTKDVSMVDLGACTPWSVAVHIPPVESVLCLVGLGAKRTSVCARRILAM